MAADGNEVWPGTTGPANGLHKSGNLQEEKVSLAHHRLLVQPDSWRLGSEFTNHC